MNVGRGSWLGGKLNCENYGLSYGRRMNEGRESWLGGKLNCENGLSYGRRMNERRGSWLGGKLNCGDENHGRGLRDGRRVNTGRRGS